MVAKPPSDFDNITHLLTVARIPPWRRPHPFSHVHARKLLRSKNRRSSFLSCSLQVEVYHRYCSDWSCSIASCGQIHRLPAPETICAHPLSCIESEYYLETGEEAYRGLTGIPCFVYLYLLAQVAVTKTKEGFQHATQKITLTGPDIGQL